MVDVVGVVTVTDAPAAYAWSTLLETVVLPNKSLSMSTTFSNVTFLMEYALRNVDLRTSCSDNNVPKTVNGIVARTNRSSPIVFIVSKETWPNDVEKRLVSLPHANRLYGNIWSTR